MTKRLDVLSDITVVAVWSMDPMWSVRDLGSCKAFDDQVEAVNFSSSSNVAIYQSPRHDRKTKAFGFHSFNFKMPPQIKQDLNRAGWETTDFPSVCENVRAIIILDELNRVALVTWTKLTFYSAFLRTHSSRCLSRITAQNASFAHAHSQSLPGKPTARRARSQLGSA